MKKSAFLTKRIALSCLIVALPLVLLTTGCGNKEDATPKDYYTGQMKSKSAPATASGGSKAMSKEESH
jgi:hypothetical protein